MSGCFETEDPHSAMHAVQNLGGDAVSDRKSSRIGIHVQMAGDETERHLRLGGPRSENDQGHVRRLFGSAGAFSPEIRPNSSRQAEKVLDGW
jgi:hypothetical protein